MHGCKGFTPPVARHTEFTFSYVCCERHASWNTAVSIYCLNVMFCCLAHTRLHAFSEAAGCKLPQHTVWFVHAAMHAVMIREPAQDY